MTERRHEWTDPETDMRHAIVGGVCAPTPSPTTTIMDGHAQPDGSVRWKQTNAYGSVIRYASYLASELDKAQKLIEEVIAAQKEILEQIDEDTEHINRMSVEIARLKTELVKYRPELNEDTGLWQMPQRRRTE